MHTICTVYYCAFFAFRNWEIMEVRNNNQAHARILEFA